MQSWSSIGRVEPRGSAQEVGCRNGGAWVGLKYSSSGRPLTPIRRSGRVGSRRDPSDDQVSSMKPTKSFPPPPTTALDFPTDLTNSVLHLAKEADEGRSRVGTGVVLGSEERAPRVRGDIRQAKPGRFPASIPFPACEICCFVEIWFLDPNLYLGSTKIEFEAVRCGKESFLFALLSCSFILGVVGLETKNLRFGCGFADLGFEREMPGFRSFALICC
ncbi:hypothetical protein B296_00036722 [Ensete ventricosum]|uniref:Uncharacterized protein n=1 Tax=Ensete ventricosum TaxID=4639 RepID=A0A426Y6D4_ENSVE|nr:hypothetical protein B296_00036722 [Ensete ventricosum]